MKALISDLRLGLESRGTHQRSTGDQGTGQWRLAFTIYPSPQLNDSSEDIDLLGHGLAASSGDLSCDSRANSDYEDTDGEGAYTDREGGPQYVDEEAPPMALARSSEPVWVDDHQELMDHGMITAEWATQVGTWPCRVGGHDRTSDIRYNPLHMSTGVTACLLFPPGRQPLHLGPEAPGQHAVSAHEGCRPETAPIGPLHDPHGSGLPEGSDVGAMAA